MISFIVWSVYLYLVQLMIPNFIKSRIEYSTRANKAFKNLSESFSIFLALAILSIVLNVEANTQLAMYWLIARVLFVIIYVSGLGIKNKGAEGSGNEVQPIRSVVWMVSVVLLVLMAKNLL